MERLDAVRPMRSSMWSRIQCRIRAGAAFAVCSLFGLMACAIAQAPVQNHAVALAVVDENGAAVAGAQVTLEQPGRAAIRLATDYSGHSYFTLQGSEPYRLRVERPGFYESVVNAADPLQRDQRVVLNHEQVVNEQVSVTGSAPGIDTTQTSDRFTMNVPEIVNVPYPTSRDIRNLLPFYPGVVQDLTGQPHVAGAETWQTLDTLDGFDIRSPISGSLSMRFSADAVRSIDTETTRYPVEYGRSTGGVFAFFTGMGDNKFRFNTTDFLPSFEDINGIRFDKFVPRLTFSGPIVRNRAWFFDGFETEYDDIYIRELPENADTDHLLRGSNLVRFQANLRPANILTGGLLFNDLHSPYDGISALVPQQSTTNRDTIAWLPYMRDQQSFHNGALLDLGFAVARFRDGYEPHGDSQYELTPELAQGSYFESLTGKSQRIEGNAVVYLPPRRWLGQHDVKAGIDLDHIGFSEAGALAPVDYLRENGTLLRRSVFSGFEPFTRQNAELGAYIEDRWALRGGVLLEPGLRFDWDEIVRRPLAAPRLAAVYAPPGTDGRTKLSAGAGLYYEHTQLEYLTRAFNGTRYDTYYAADGTTPTATPIESVFTANDGSLREARALNWSVEAEQRLPGAVYFKAGYLWKRLSDAFTYANQNAASPLFGTYALSNGRIDNDRVESLEARRTFTGGYTLFAAYTHSSAHTNSAIDYMPTVSTLGTQQGGPLAWDSPNRLISWGWLPFLAPGFRKRWDFVYTLDRHTGFPYTAVDAGYEIVGAPGAHRFPDYTAFSPGLEWRFHFRGSYFGLRGVIENITNSGDYQVVNSVVDSPQFGTFSEPLGRAVTARLRLIGESK
jgi:hypothetical protein